MYKKNWRFLIPQQLFIFLALTSAAEAIINSRNADGVTRPQLFILADQIYIVIISIIHTFALLKLITKDK